MKLSDADRHRSWLIATGWLLCALVAGPWSAHGATPPFAPQVSPPKTKLPQSVTPPEPLKIKSAPPQQVIVPGLQPGKIIEMTLAGGRPPIQIAIDAGPSSHLFSVARRPVVGRQPREPVQPFQPGSANRLSSVDDLVGIRYAGAASATQLGSQIPVTIRATDSGGATVATSMVVFPVVPELRIEPHNFNNVIARQPITVTVQVERLPPGVGVTGQQNRLFENLTVAETNCFFLTNRVGTRANADLSGRVAIQVEGTFGVRNPTATPGSCTLAMEFDVGGSGVGAHRFLLKKGNITLTAPVRYTVENTNSLSSLFKFSPSTNSRDLLGGTFGVCSGTSFGVEAVSVGMLEIGNDLAFRIRSGPIGTGCEWRSRRVDVTSGLRLIRMNWEVTKVGSKCCSGALTNCEPENPLGTAIWTDAIPMVASRDFNASFPFYDGGAATVAAGIDGSPRSGGTADWGISYFIPMTVRLRCDPTLVNDHGITLRLNSVELEGPPGRKFP